MIEVEKLSKTFKVFDRREGLKGTFLDMFQRRYRYQKAVDEVSFKIDKGEMVGYLGANGAGKSTTIKMLTGILHPSSGHLKVAGFVPHDERKSYLRHIGVVFGQRTQLWWDLAVQESFRLLQRIYAVSEEDYQKRMSRFNEVLSLNEFLRTPVRKLSLGQKMRCELAAALLHQPSVLFLDEPTIGLDVDAKVSIREFLKEMNQELGITVILTTHDLKDIEELCKRVVIIDQGQLVHDGELSELSQKLGGETKMKFHLEKSLSQQEQAQLNFEGLVQWQVDEGLAKASFDATKIKRADVIRRVLEVAEVHDLSLEEPSIEEVVRKVYRGEMSKEIK